MTYRHRDERPDHERGGKTERKRRADERPDQANDSRGDEVTGRLDPGYEPEGRAAELGGSKGRDRRILGGLGRSDPDAGQHERHPEEDDARSGRKDEVSKDETGHSDGEHKLRTVCVDKPSGGQRCERPRHVVAHIQRDRIVVAPLVPWLGVRSSVVRRMSRVAATLPASNRETDTRSRPSGPRRSGRTTIRTGAVWRSLGRCRWRTA